MIHSVVISVGGKGTRLGSIGTTIPKSLVPLNNQPFLWYLLNNIININPTADIYVVFGFLGEYVKDFIAAYPEFSQVVTVSQYEQCGEDAYGTLIPFKAVRTFLSDTTFLSLHGDNLYSIQDLKAAMNIDSSDSYIGVYDVSQETSRHGSVFFDDQGYLTHIQHQSDPPNEHLPSTPYNFSGLSICTPEIWQVIDTITPAHNGEYRVTEALLALPRVQRLVQKDGMLHLTYAEDVPKLEQHLKKYI